MKKRFSLFLALLMVLTCVMSAASAIDYGYYEQHQKNEATFETLEEARVNGPAWLNQEYPHRVHVADPALDEYPVGTTYIYRAPGMYCNTSAAVRMNTNILVYTDKAFESKDAAFAYIKELGLTDKADEATGSVVLVTPADPAKGFGIADQYAYYLLQSAMCNIGYSKRTDAGTLYYMDAGYYGGLTNRYLIGIDGGASFINDYIASNLDYISRIGGLLLVGGKMEKIRTVAGCVPTWMVNPGAFMVERYKAGNQTDSCGRLGDNELYYNSKHPLQKVIVTTTEEVDLAAAINNAYYGMFIHAMRIPVVKANLNTASTKFADYKWNQAPYTLSERNPIINGRTLDGIQIIERQEERFAHIATDTGEYVTTWYELLPDEVLDGSAADESIPLIVCNHGGGDDPIQAVDELGFLKLIGEKRVAIVAMRHTSENPTINFMTDKSPFDTMSDLLPALAQYMLDTSPALDPERVYVTGYSMGGSCTNRAVYGDASKFAAAVNMSGTPYNHLEGQDEQFKEIDIPMMLTTCTYDTWTHFDSANGIIAPDFQMNVNDYLSYNEMDTVEFDFDTYPMSGFKGDIYLETMVNDEYPLYQWFFLNEKKAPMVGLTVIEFIPHGLYQEYAEIAWNYFKHFSRDKETKEIVYNPYAY